MASNRPSMQTALIQISALNIPSVPEAKFEAEFGIQKEGECGTFGGSGRLVGATTVASPAIHCASIIFMTRRPPREHAAPQPRESHAGGSAAANMLPGTPPSKAPSGHRLRA